MYQEDKGGGWRLIPGLRVRVKIEDEAHEIRTNSSGFRDREHQKAKLNRAFRLLVLGDSFTFGWGVGAEEVYWRLLENELSRDGYEQSAGLKVLDYGCGNGYVLSNYAKNRAIAVGVDIAWSAISLARARFRIMGLTGFFLQNDGEIIPFRSDEFDIACAMGMLHHVPDPGPIVKELHRVLKPGGRLIVMVYNRNSFRYQVGFRWLRYFGGRAYRSKSLQELVKMNDGVGNPFGTVYTVDEVRSLLADFTGHSFRVNKLGVRELALHSRILMPVLSRVLPVRFVSSFLAS